MVYSTRSGLIDQDVVSYNLYNSFNYSFFLPEEHERINCSFGIISPNKGEGKTVTACNLGAAIAIGTSRRTVLIDLNLSRPRLHEIFGTNTNPGISNALDGKEICVCSTQIENLFVLPSGNSSRIRVSQLGNFNKILNSLFHDFEFVIVDMPSPDAKNFPTLIANQLNGLIVVTEVRKTRRRDIDRLFRHVHERNVIGFVLNKVNENDF